MGRHAGRERPWILPEDDWELGLWPGIRTGGAHPVAEYLERNGVQRHTGSNNLKSSWVLCANLYFTFGAAAAGRELLASFLKSRVFDRIETVESVELEFAANGDLHPSQLLGEEGGSRGSGQTSPDVAFIANGGRSIVLTESKLAEHSFYDCSARTRESTPRREGNPDPSRCNEAIAVLDDSPGRCHQLHWGRRYLPILAPVASREAWGRLSSCPAARAGYQLLRQQALAEGMAGSGKYDFVVSCVARDDRNETLAKSLRATGIDSIEAWGALFEGRARFATFTHQEWFQWVKAADAPQFWEWINWVGARYGFD